MQELSRKKTHIKKYRNRRKKFRKKNHSRKLELHKKQNLKRKRNNTTKRNHKYQSRPKKNKSLTKKHDDTQIVKKKGLTLSPTPPPSTSILKSNGISFGNRKLGMFPQVPGTPGTESPSFPPLIPNDETPIIINSPPVELPKKQKPQDLQGHIIFVPTIIYPKRKKRIIVHHDNSLMGYYNKFLYGGNGYYLNWMKQNKAYEQWMKHNPFWQAAEKDSNMQKYLEAMKPPSSRLII